MKIIKITTTQRFIEHEKVNVFSVSLEGKDSPVAIVVVHENYYKKTGLDRGIGNKFMFSFTFQELMGDLNKEDYIDSYFKNAYGIKIYDPTSEAYEDTFIAAKCLRDLIRKERVSYKRILSDGYQRPL